VPGALVSFVDVRNAEQDVINHYRQTAPSQVPTIKQFQRFRDAIFIPVETDSFAAADEKALRAFVDRYPGSANVIRAFIGMRNQFVTA